ncbi:MAG TPA: hypothetical protein VIF14_15980 [Alphaproteobacteria bacterium]
MAEPKYCDIIMRGGITSGVVYPGAVVELAKTYTFKNVGGASAGAIAAAMTAAAQYAKSNGAAGPKAGFDGIAEMPGWFGGTSRDANAAGRSNMLTMFQPQASTARLFTILMRVINAGTARTEGGRVKFEKATPFRTALRVAFGMVAAFPLIAAVLGLIGLAVAASAYYGGAEVARAWGGWRLLVGALAGVLALLASLGASAAALGYVAYKYAGRSLPKNFFGICSGGDNLRDPRYSSSNPPPLGHWMTEAINELAGKARTAAEPLTFGDLWGEGKGVKDADLRLQVMTTDLSRSRPYRMPFDDDDEPFYFAPSEFERLFPNDVVKRMVAQSRIRIAADKAKAAKGEKSLQLRDDAEFGAGGLKLLPLPVAADLPVVVATRMSMSFPLLLSAVPLYTLERGEGGATRPLRHWFSDGGMCSNFPIHLFDSPIPRWPTFGINLRYFDEHHRSSRGRAAPESRIYVPESDGDQEFSFNYPVDDSKVTSFFGAIKSAMQNWLDFAQMDYPGFRDRIAQVYLNSKEGGMNLAMPKEAIQKLSDRGKDAAATLAAHFAPGSTVPYNWPNHQTVRFLNFMRLSGGAFAAFDRSYTDAKYAQLLAAIPGADARAQEFTRLAATMRQDLRPEGSVFGQPAPLPYAIFRIMPDV